MNITIIFLYGSYQFTRHPETYCILLCRTVMKYIFESLVGLTIVQIRYVRKLYLFFIVHPTRRVVGGSRGSVCTTTILSVIIEHLTIIKSRHISYLSITYSIGRILLIVLYTLLYYTLVAKLGELLNISDLLTLSRLL